MHIPDGYLSPATCGIMYAAVIPLWARAIVLMRRAFDDRSLPLLAILSAFSFILMMFNVPVPGGTTAHAVGGVLMAILVGPWAAFVGESIALTVQAIFFGDGGITAIGANCFNMGFVLTFVGYFFYRLISRNSPLSSRRRWIAAAVGGYIGINAAAFMVAVELGIQPYFFHTTGGTPLYCPYALNQTIPAMVIVHLFVGLIEAVITAAVVAFLGKYHPEMLRFSRGKEKKDERL